MQNKKLPKIMTKISTTMIALFFIFGAISLVYAQEYKEFTQEEIDFVNNLPSTEMTNLTLNHKYSPSACCGDSNTSQ
jgi:preprotein translocase subunit SecG